MKSISFLFLCFNLPILAAIVVSLLTCPADLGAECSDAALDDWKGEFFPDIQKIKYEGPSSKNLLSYKWSNADEEILGKKMKVGNKPTLVRVSPLLTHRHLSQRRIRLLARKYHPRNDGLKVPFFR